MSRSPGWTSFFGRQKRNFVCKDCGMSARRKIRLFDVPPACPHGHGPMLRGTPGKGGRRARQGARWWR